MALNFEDYQKDANNWLSRIAAELGVHDREQAGRIFRAVLHALRDRIPASEAIHFGAQLPIIWKGVYFDGFTMHEPEKIRNQKDWLEFIKSKDPFAENIDFPTDEHVRLGFRDIMRALKDCISEGQYEQLVEALPMEIRELCGNGVYA